MTHNETISNPIAKIKFNQHVSRTNPQHTGKYMSFKNIVMYKQQETSIK